MKDFVKYLEDIPTDTKDTLNLVDSVLPRFKEAMKEKISFIGFEGSWGSGKTSVLKALQNEDLYKGYIYFIFSAWSSNNDSIKRDFIHKLETTLSKHSKQKKCCCQKIVEWMFRVLLGVLKWGLVTTFIFGIWIGIGETVHNLLHETLIYKFVPDWIKWIFIGLLTLVSDIILLISAKGNASEIIRTFLPIEETTPSTDIPDYEFIDKLTKLVNKQNQKLCIVLDNIDRLMPSQIESSLSLLYSLKDFSQDLSEDSSKKEGIKTAIIVPYDAVQLDNIFYNVIPQKKIIQREIFQKEKLEQNNYLLSVDYINRVFPIKISIPQLTDHEMLKKIYSNLYRAGFKIFDKQAELTDDDISIMEKLYEHIVSHFPNDRFTKGINYRYKEENLEEVSKHFIFEKIFISYSQNLNNPIVINEVLLQKFNQFTISGSTYSYPDIKNSDEFIEAFTIHLMKKYNEFIKDSTNTDFYKMKKLCCYSIYIFYYIEAIQTPIVDNPRDKYNNWRNPRYQLQQINRMVHCRMSFEQKFKDHDVLMSDKENIFDVLYLCYLFGLCAPDPNHLFNVTTWSNAYEDIWYDDLFIQ